MNNTFYFLRHARTKIDRTIPVSKFVLSEAGLLQAENLAGENFFDDIEIIYCSTEQKAYQTALPIARKLDKEIFQKEDLCELDRDKGGFLELNDFDKAVQECLFFPDKSIHNWETSNHGLDRFCKQIGELNAQHTNRKILIVGHGLTINLYFAKLLGALDHVYERLGRNDFADWGIVRNQEVIKDIAC